MKGFRASRPRFQVLVAALVSLAAAPLTARAQEAAAPLVLEYYTLRGCHDCEEYERGTLVDVVRRLERDFPAVSVVSYDVLETASFERLQARLGAAGREYGGTPIIVAGRIVLQGEELSEETAVVRILEDHLRVAPNGAPRSGEAREVRDPRTALSLPLVLAAGLLDGVNPCALTILVFLISSLALGRASRNLMLWTGLGFAAGVFMAYTLTGFGLFGIADALRGNRSVSEAVRIATIVFLLMLAALSLRDAVLLSRGKTANVSLRLPAPLTRAIHALIRNLRDSRSVGPAAGIGAAALGAAVSMLEFVCTGQVYLPTIVYIARTSPADGGLLLVLYNLAFIAPLLAVLSLVFFGIEQTKLAGFVKDRVVAVKIGTSCLFLLLSLVLIFS